MQLLWGIIKFIVIILSSLWVGVFVWTHQPLGRYVNLALISVWVFFTLAVLVSIIKPTLFSSLLSHQSLLLIFFAVVAIAIACFFSMSASNERDWNPEVAQMLDYRLDRDGNTLTISNVRNFDWQDKTHFQARWETRQYDLAKLQTVDFIASYWMGDAIAHTLVSFWV